VAGQQELLVLVGIQGSGKSVVAGLVGAEGYVVASNDITGGRDKTVR
jgi:predicted kinase